MAFANGVLLQCFQWYTPADGTLWSNLAGWAEELANRGFTAVWLPPPGKGQAGGFDVGYGAYDLFDLGEFPQKGSTRTKYGTKDELVAAVHALHQHGIQTYADVVFNHKDGGDVAEEVWAQEVSWDDRNRALSDWFPIRAWTGFQFAGRGSTHSSYQWH
jgi:alpha-amylase